MRRILDGIIVIDLSRLFPGPYCSMILGDYGARVICVEDRRFEGEVIPELAGVNRNKEHMALNLKSKKGREIFFKLIEKADVILEGFRPGVTARLGVSYEDVKRVNPRIVYCSITGYGQTGPLKDLPGHDVNYMSESGVLSQIGPRGEAPVIPGVQFADLTAGLNGAVSILLSLYDREKTGQGNYIDVSMTDCLTALLPFPVGLYQKHGKVPERSNMPLSHRYACYNVYETADGKYVSLGALEARFWVNLCNDLGFPEYGPLQYDESKRDEIIDHLKSVFKTQTREYWVKRFQDKDVCLAGINEIDEVLSGKHVEERNMKVSIEEPGKAAMEFLGIPIKHADAPGDIRTLPPTFGQHTRDILMEWGYSEKDVETLEHEGVI